ncbi:DNA (cytosine-5-)-methyltransferase [Vibrio parahaemolyticus]|uniref:DNA cytosine methyltransferase n=1 Tax=Vibrio parahaemolyticus TaxID=670 RepID=UPI001120A3B9|nr:DNA (cytosine-5-)-methyltransferase [Vibrio parahaemolyticus]MBE4804866.1 DNA cytosine methyltransferase [Vibrio parahaemolyticus]TOK16208.1 DNA (cytosine-5-)-methyltransferase [Vibrio parahaemolyticus]HCH4150912.1 DNA cytosine methyltransferase [Vibrio parahaemolyticus]
MNHIELFSGCGGLSLGLAKAGFELTFANELSPMAAETFAYNLLNEDLGALAEKDKKSKKVYWLSSQYVDLTNRLRENPFEYPTVGKGITDITNDYQKLNGSLLVGNIIHLNQLLEAKPQLLTAIKSGFGSDGIDLVSGGPPCQSFSLAGLRKKECDKNLLPWEFAKFVGMVEPKLVILENVSGILRPFNEDGVKYYAWFEVAKAFAEQGYIPLCLHVNARLAGVPQNRPRFIMLAIRKDILSSISHSFNEYEIKLLSPCLDLFENTQAGKTADIRDYRCYDVNISKDLELFRNSFLAPLVGDKEVSVKMAIHDLCLTKKSKKSPYVQQLNEKFESVLGKARAISNHIPRKNSELVKRRFRIYQVLQKSSQEARKQVFSILKGEVAHLSDSVWEELKKHKFVSLEGKYVNFNSKESFTSYLKAHPTKKRSQRALDEHQPAPAALSIPDDACHYDSSELRTLTVREMARIQSFPDAFKFRSKVTTGGTMRRSEVPQYTQVGNAVPPLLGVKLGSVISQILER